MPTLAFGSAAVPRDVHRHEHAEGRSPGQRVAFHDAAVIPDDLGNECKTEATGIFVCTVTLDGYLEITDGSPVHAKTLVYHGDVLR